MPNVHACARMHACVQVGGEVGARARVGRQEGGRPAGRERGGSEGERWCCNPSRLCLFLQTRPVAPAEEIKMNVTLCMMSEA